jgi:hypothetical protein
MTRSTSGGLRRPAGAREPDETGADRAKPGALASWLNRAPRGARALRRNGKPRRFFVKLAEMRRIWGLRKFGFAFVQCVECFE